MPPSDVARFQILTPAAVAMAALVDRTSWTWPRRLLLGLLGRFEALGGWPTRLVTGYYVAFAAEKTGGRADVVYAERG